MTVKPLIPHLDGLTAADITRLDNIASEHRLREDEPGRWHLGASVIGSECSRQIWYGFRWVKRVVHSGSLHRLFERGHMEEARFVQSLRAIGLTVHEFDGQGKQFKFSTLHGHFGGSCDGFATNGTATALLSFKTHNQRSFDNLQKQGKVRLSKPRHYDQECCYGSYFGTALTIYCAVNKNTDERYYEIFENDYKIASDLTKKAEYVITSMTPPPRISNSPAYSACKMCDFRGPCWGNEPPEKNCRSCRYCSPAENAQWNCDFHGGIIPRAFVKHGCDQYRMLDT